MRILSSVSGLIALALAVPLVAQEGLRLTTESFKEIEETAADGRKQKKMVPTERVVPGDEVVYVITYKNLGAQPAEKVVVTNPVPEALEYKAAAPAASGAQPEVSVDGGKTWGPLARLKVAGADGQSRAAQPADVTHVRWTLGSAVKPGEEGRVTYRAVLE